MNEKERQELGVPDGYMVHALHMTGRDGADRWGVEALDSSWTVDYYANRPAGEEMITALQSIGWNVSHVYGPAEGIVFLAMLPEITGEERGNAVRVYSLARQQFLSPHQTVWQWEQDNYTNGTYCGPFTLGQATKIRHDFDKAIDGEGVAVFAGERLVIVRQGNGYNVARILVTIRPRDTDKKARARRMAQEALSIIAFWQYDPLGDNDPDSQKYVVEFSDNNDGQIFDMFTATSLEQAEQAAQDKINFLLLADDLTVTGSWLKAGQGL